jgi:hypothetical protein
VPTYNFLATPTPPVTIKVPVVVEDASVAPPKVKTSVDVLYVKFESSTINPEVDTNGTRPEVKVATVTVFAEIAPVPAVKEFTVLAASLNVLLNSLNVFDNATCDIGIILLSL